jgi:hypothetical protein
VDLYHCKSLDFGPLKDWQLFPPWLLALLDSTRLELVGTRLVGFALHDRHLGLLNIRFAEIAIQQENNIWTQKFPRSSLDEPLGLPELDFHLLMAGGAKHNDDHP